LCHPPMAFLPSKKFRSGSFLATSVLVQALCCRQRFGADVASKSGVFSGTKISFCKQDYWQDSPGKLIVCPSPWVKNSKLLILVRPLAVQLWLWFFISFWFRLYGLHQPFRGFNI
jgi:hypothetical protein